jgi:hypothetical protein
MRRGVSPAARTFFGQAEKGNQNSTRNQFAVPTPSQPGQRRNHRPNQRNEIMSTNAKTARGAALLGAGLMALTIVATPLAASAGSAYDDDYSDQLWKQQVEQSRTNAPIHVQVTKTNQAYVPVPEFNGVAGPGPQG